MIRRIVFLLCLPAYIGSSVLTVALSKSTTWDDFLPAIAYVESSNQQWSQSYLGASFGRGLYHVSDVCFTHWKWYHMDHWVVKQNLDATCLYNTNVCREVALWYLIWLGHYYSGRSNQVDLVLSAYNQGPTYTDKNGVTTQYVRAVRNSMQK